MAFINLKKQANLPPRLIRNLMHDSHLFISDDPYWSFLGFFEKHAALSLCSSVQGRVVRPIQVFWGRYKKGHGINSEKLRHDRMNPAHLREEFGGSMVGSPDMAGIPLSGWVFDRLAARLVYKKQYFVFVCAGTSSVDRRIMVNQDNLIHIKEFSGMGCTLGDIRTGLVEGAASVKKFVKYLN